MTHVDHIQGKIARPIGVAKLGYPQLIACVALLAVLCVSLPNLADPMIRFDDYPAYFADPTHFYMKTLSEGRWVNYWWHLRGFVTPSWVNFALYQVLWAAFAASVAYSAMRSDQERMFGPILAVIIIVAPPATMISLWFNTLLPGLGLVALYAVLGVVLTQSLHRALLPPFVIAGFMAYTTYPLLLLTVCLVCTKQRSLKDLAGLIVLFVLSFSAALMVAYGLNYHAHGVFGIQLSDWREANGAANIGDAMSNFPVALDSFRTFLSNSSYAFPPVAVFHLLMLAISIGVLARNSASEALYLGGGLLLGLVFITLQCLKTGAVAPNRAFVFAWVIYAILVVRSAQILCSQEGLVSRLAKNSVFLILGLYVMQTFVQYSSYRDWQIQTRNIFERTPYSAQPLFVNGDVVNMTSAKKANIQDPLALVFRAQQLGVSNVVLCSSDTSECEGTVEVQINLDDL